MIAGLEGEAREMIWSNEDILLVKENQVWEYLRKLDALNSMCCNWMNSGVLRKQVDVIAKLLSVFDCGSSVRSVWGLEYNKCYSWLQKEYVTSFLGKIIKQLILEATSRLRTRMSLEVSSTNLKGLYSEVSGLVIKDRAVDSALSVSIRPLKHCLLCDLCKQAVNVWAEYVQWKDQKLAENLGPESDYQWSGVVGQ